MAEIHGLVAQLALVLGVICVGWAGVLVARGAAGGTFFIVNLGWTVVAILVAAIVGGLLLVSGSGPSDGLHVLYGALALVALPGAALVSSGRTERQRMIVLLVGSIVLLILVVRLFQTG